MTTTLISTNTNSITNTISNTKISRRSFVIGTGTGARDWLVLVNASPRPVQFTLPAGTWRLALSSAPDAAPESSPDSERLPPLPTLPDSCLWIATT